eukprot:scaffold14458_cov107-Isochrysis_galbana.AAC.2
MARTARLEVKSAFTTSRAYSAGLALRGSGLPIRSRWDEMSEAGPKKAMRPPERMSVSSKPSTTEADGWWIVQTMAMPIVCATVFSKAMILAAAAESRPDVGSSRKMTDGRLASAHASESRRFCPPDRPRKKMFPALVCWQLVRPVASSNSSMAASRSALPSDGRYRQMALRRWSRQVRKVHSVSCCVTTAQCLA